MSNARSWSGHRGRDYSRQDDRYQPPPSAYSRDIGPAPRDLFPERAQYIREQSANSQDYRDSREAREHPYATGDWRNSRDNRDRRDTRPPLDGPPYEYDEFRGYQDRPPYSGRRGSNASLGNGGTRRRSMTPPYYQGRRASFSRGDRSRPEYVDNYRPTEPRPTVRARSPDLIRREVPRQVSRDFYNPKDERGPQLPRQRDERAHEIPASRTVSAPRPYRNTSQPRSSSFQDRPKPRTGSLGPRDRPYNSTTAVPSIRRSSDDATHRVHQGERLIGTATSTLSAVEDRRGPERHSPIPKDSQIGHSSVQDRSKSPLSSKHVATQRSREGSTSDGIRESKQEAEQIRNIKHNSDGEVNSPGSQVNDEYINPFDLLDDASSFDDSRPSTGVTPQLSPRKESQLMNEWHAPALHQSEKKELTDLVDEDEPSSKSKSEDAYRGSRSPGALSEASTIYMENPEGQQPQSIRGSIPGVSDIAMLQSDVGGAESDDENAAESRRISQDFSMGEGANDDNRMRVLGIDTVDTRSDQISHQSPLPPVEDTMSIKSDLDDLRSTSSATSTRSNTPRIDLPLDGSRDRKPVAGINEEAHDSLRLDRQLVGHDIPDISDLRESQAEPETAVSSNGEISERSSIKEEDGIESSPLMALDDNQASKELISLKVAEPSEVEGETLPPEGVLHGHARENVEGGKKISTEEAGRDQKADTDNPVRMIASASPSSVDKDMKLPHERPRVEGESYSDLLDAKLGTETAADSVMSDPPITREPVDIQQSNDGIKMGIINEETAATASTSLAEPRSDKDIQHRESITAESRSHANPSDSVRVDHIINQTHETALPRKLKVNSEVRRLNSEIEKIKQRLSALSGQKSVLLLSRKDVESELRDTLAVKTRAARSLALPVRSYCSAYDEMLSKNILTQNKDIVKDNSAYYRRRIYKSPSEYTSYQENLEIMTLKKAKIVALLQRQKLSLIAEDDALRNEYEQRQKKWLKHTAKCDRQRLLEIELEDAETASIISGAGPTRGTRNKPVGYEIKEAMIGVDLPNNVLNEARIPKLISDPLEVALYSYVDLNHLVPNPLEYYYIDRFDPREVWTEAEQAIFSLRYKATPKQFGVIAAGLPGRTAQDCVVHYYKTKKVLDYRASGKPKVKTAGRGRGRAKKVIPGRSARRTLLATVSALDGDDDDIEDETEVKSLRKRRALNNLDETQRKTRVLRKATKRPIEEASAEQESAPQTNMAHVVQQHQGYDASVSMATPSEPISMQPKQAPSKPAVRQPARQIQKPPPLDPSLQHQVSRHIPQAHNPMHFPHAHSPQPYHHPQQPQQQSHQSRSLPVQQHNSIHRPLYQPPPNISQPPYEDRRRLSWSEQDEVHFTELLSRYGTDWSAMVHHMPSKTTEQLQKHFNEFLVERQYRQLLPRPNSSVRPLGATFSQQPPNQPYSARAPLLNPPYTNQYSGLGASQQHSSQSHGVYNRPSSYQSGQQHQHSQQHQHAQNPPYNSQQQYNYDYRGQPPSRPPYDSRPEEPRNLGIDRKMSLAPHRGSIDSMLNSGERVQLPPINSRAPLATSPDGRYGPSSFFNPPSHYAPPPLSSTQPSAFQQSQDARYGGGSNGYSYNAPQSGSNHNGNNSGGNNNNNANNNNNNNAMNNYNRNQPWR